MLGHGLAAQTKGRVPGHNLVRHGTACNSVNTAGGSAKVVPDTRVSSVASLTLGPTGHIGKQSTDRKVIEGCGSG